MDRTLKELEGESLVLDGRIGIQISLGALRGDVEHETLLGDRNFRLKQRVRDVVNATEARSVTRRLALVRTIAAGVIGGIFMHRPIRGGWGIRRGHLSTILPQNLAQQ